MANQVLMTISRDERERERLMQEERILLDYYSGINYMKKKGLAEGIQIGTEIGNKEGRKERDQEILKLADQVSSLEDLEKFKQFLRGH